MREVRALGFDRSTRKATLTAPSVCMHCSLRSQNIFSKAGVLRELTLDEVVIREGEPLTSLFYIRTGAVSLRTRDKGKEKHIAQREQGSIIGEMSFLNGEVPGVTVAAATPNVSLWELTHQQLISLLESKSIEVGLLFKMVRRRIAMS